MIRFLLKGIFHDKSRSLLPVVVISIGVTLTVLSYCWEKGIMGDAVVMTANFNTGHVKVMTRVYAKDEEQKPNDLAIIGVDKLINELGKDNPGIDWVERIRFGGLIDFPDEKGETRAQGPAVGWAVDLLSTDSKEKERLNIEKSLVRGKFPDNKEEALISDDLAEKFDVEIGDEFTLFSSAMNGSMAFKNFIVAGTLRFGTAALDRGAIIIDVTDAQTAFNMEDAAGEILGYFRDGIYDDDKAAIITNTFNEKYKTDPDEFAPKMFSLSEQNGMGEQIEYTNTMGAIMAFIFVMAMSVVLWNAGLIGGLRRYTEFGVRLALGEEKKHIYKTLIYEGVLIGAIGSITGTVIGLGVSYYIQAVGIDLGDMMQQSTSIMMPSIVRTVVTPTAFYIGFIPGLFSMVLGNALSGIGIYKRKTAQLFKELET